MTPLEAVLPLPILRDGGSGTAPLIGRLAARALRAELMCFPKPGCVSVHDSGSHRDMDARHFIRSIGILAPYFEVLAAAGEREAAFEELKEIGIGAEAAMLAATGGINTHRGAIFSMGLLAAAAGLLIGRGQPPAPRALGRAVVRRWGSAIRRHSGGGDSHGGISRSLYGAGGARDEAVRGFPTLVTKAYPALEEGVAIAGDWNAALVHTIFAVIAVLDDTNILFRAGREGLVWAQEMAGGF
ncbi:MAG: triphosphoribosyl-dephospho-CoA synthase, partial [Candidatus Aureabacteria bacterium]|nr:triphosphoribosyl-dephospho-CoA synthase [Candidatus Auribacterota bacterium]